MRCLIVAVSVAVAGASAGAVSAASPQRVVRAQVAAKEFTFGLSRPKVQPGLLILQLVNYGQDPHDLRLQRIASTRQPTLRLDEVAPGDRASLRVQVRPGRYRLWCSLPGHRKEGMSALLTVTGR